MNNISDVNNIAPKEKQDKDMRKQNAKQQKLAAALRQNLLRRKQASPNAKPEDQV